MSISASPVHSIHEYANGIYKVVTFKGSRDPDNAYLRIPDATQHYDNKLDNSFSRARNMVLQYALCNSWDYFFTGTIDRAKFDRFNLDIYQSRLSQFVRDKRKKYQSQIQYLLVPEQHKDGAWHTLINKSQATVVNVVTNNTYLTNVYQLDDENDVADRSKEGIEKVSGMFKWLWKNAFKDAFGAADVTKLDGLL